MARCWQHPLRVAWLGGLEHDVIDKAAGERRVLPIDAEPLAKLARIRVDSAAGKKQDRHSLAGNQRELTILARKKRSSPAQSSTSARSGHFASARRLS